jgi:hypothetical protein
MLFGHDLETNFNRNSLFYYIESRATIIFRYQFKLRKMSGKQNKNKNKNKYKRGKKRGKRSNDEQNQFPEMTKKIGL